MKVLHVVSLGAALACLSQMGAAQTAQKFAVQGSVLHEDGRGEAFNWVGDSLNHVPGGFGAEAQLRYTASAVSWGAGIQMTRHSWIEQFGGSKSCTNGECSGPNFDWKLDMIGVFLEPRYVLPVSSATFGPYLAARLALTRQTVNVSDVTGHATGETVNGGGGVLVRLAPRVNLDLGATYGYTHLGDFSFENSPNDKSPNGNGTNLITRVGLAFGLGH
jgi:hypothetical protein